MAVWGIDLGISEAQSSVACWHPRSGRFQVLAAFPRRPSLEERGLSDGVSRTYRKMQERGELVLAGDLVVNVSELIETALLRFGPPDLIATDHVRFKELEEALAAARVPFARLEKRVSHRHGGDDLRDFRRAIITGRVKAEKSLLMRHSLRGSRVFIDRSGASRLARGSESGRLRAHRDDPTSAAILAIAVGHRLKLDRARARRVAIV